RPGQVRDWSAQLRRGFVRILVREQSLRTKGEGIVAVTSAAEHAGICERVDQPERQKEASQGDQRQDPPPRSCDSTYKARDQVLASHHKYCDARGPIRSNTSDSQVLCYLLAPG